METLTDAAKNAGPDLFDWLIRTHKPLLNTAEVERATGLSKPSVYLLAEAGEIEAHHHAISGQMVHRRYTRRSVILYMMRTASYDPDSLIEVLMGMVEDLPTRDLERLVQRIGEVVSARRTAQALQRRLVI